MIDIVNLDVARNGRSICCVPELQVGRGERVAVLGSNGCLLYTSPSPRD